MATRRPSSELCSSNTAHTQCSTSSMSYRALLHLTTEHLSKNKKKRFKCHSARRKTSQTRTLAKERRDNKEKRMMTMKMKQAKEHNMKAVAANKGKSSPKPSQKTTRRKKKNLLRKCHLLGQQ